MVRRRRRLGKYASVCFADPPWDDEHPDWVRLDQELPADHMARSIVAAMEKLDLTPLFASYGAGGRRPTRPDLMLRVVLIEMRLGRYRPSQWFRDVGEHTPLRWAGFGIRPARSCWYEFADRVAPFLDAWNRQVLDEAQRREITPATRGALDGSAVAANASRHRLLNEERLTKRQSQLQQTCAADAAGEVPETLPGWMAKTPRGRIQQSQRLEEAHTRLVELQAAAAQRAPSRRCPAEKIVVSPSDPQAALGRDKLKVFRPLYNVQLVRDLDSTFILGYELFPQTGDEGTLKPMLERLRTKFGISLETLLGDAGYASACNLALSRRHSVALSAPWQENDFTQPKKAAAKKKAGAPKFAKDKFEWLPDQNAYRCPQGHSLTAIGKECRPQSDGEVNTVYRYRCLPQHCRICPQRDACTPNPNRGRSLRRSEYEELIDNHKAHMQTDATKALYKLRRQTVELGFADLKEHRNFERFSGRGRHRARRQLALAVLAHNLASISRPPPAKK